MDYYNEIKNELIDNEVNKRVKEYSKNRYELEKYYNVGKLLIEAQGGEERAKYGDGLIKEYARKLTNELNKKYNTTTLKRMRQFFLIIQKGATMWHQLTWSHYRELLSCRNIDKINYYLNATVKQNLSVRQLQIRVKSKEYERLPESTKNKLIKKSASSVMDYVKNPILIKNAKNYEIVSEKILQRLILSDIPSFLEELGDGFTFIKNEYKIKIGNNYNYIDLLLFNIKYNAYVVVELKVTEVRKEHIGQIQVYMNYIDKHIKTIYQDKTIGIIISKKNNNFVMEYCSDPRIYNTSYELI